MVSCFPAALSFLFLLYESFSLFFGLLSLLLRTPPSSGRSRDLLERTPRLRVVDFGPIHFPLDFRVSSLFLISWRLTAFDHF